MSGLLSAGAGGLAQLRLEAADGAQAQLYLQGAHVAAWRPAGGEERLFLSQRCVWRAGSALRGGVPLIFPQFAAEGPLPRHGFARTRDWQLEAAGPDWARFVLEADAATRAIWPHDFRCRFEARIGGAQLQLALEVENSGSRSFDFTAALHSYLRVDDLSQARVLGLAGTRYRDSARGGEHHETAAALAVAGEVDRIYLDAPPQLRLAEARRGLRITQQGFADTVVWNPGAEKAAALSDLEAGGWQHFLCIEAAQVGRPVLLAPGAGWRGTQTLLAE